MSNDIKDIYSRNLYILSEIGNIGAGNATTALAQIIGNKVNMDVPQVRLLGFNELTEIIGGAENIVIGIMCRIEGDLTGMMMFMLEKAAAHRLIDIFMMDFDDGCEDEFSEMKLSALHELGNIIVGAYLNALAGLTGLKIIESIPHLSIDMAGAILSVPAIEFGKMGDEGLLIESRFFEEDRAASGYFILIPDVPSYDTILKSLHIG